MTRSGGEHRGGGVGSADWWLRDRTADGTPAEGRWAIGQPPNPAIVVFGAATVLRWSPYDALDAQLPLIAVGALIVWSADELARGANPLRRLLGAVVLVWQVVGLLT